MGPANSAAWLTDLHYHDKAALYRDLADAYNAEFKEAVAAGVRIFQLDDVGFTLHAPEDYPLVVDTINRALAGWTRSGSSISATSAAGCPSA